MTRAVPDPDLEIRGGGGGGGGGGGTGRSSRPSKIFLALPQEKIMDSHFWIFWGI